MKRQSKKIEKFSVSQIFTKWLNIQTIKGIYTTQYSLRVEAEVKDNIFPKKMLKWLIGDPVNANEIHNNVWWM